MNSHVTAISNRLRLRPPQRESLEILARICEILPLEKHADTAAALQAVKTEFPTVTDFERDFPSLCFALATGVGKSRLMEAFVAFPNLRTLALKKAVVLCHTQILGLIGRKGSRCKKQRRKPGP